VKTCKESKGKAPGFKIRQRSETAGAVGSTSSTRSGGEKNPDLTANGKLPLGQECIITHYLLTPWSRALLEKLTDFQLVKKFPAFYGTRRFITAFTSSRKYLSRPKTYYMNVP
jgi:hypothetical protein